jgi:hypothetical protein
MTTERGNSLVREGMTMNRGRATGLIAVVDAASSAATTGSPRVPSTAAATFHTLVSLTTPGRFKVRLRL